MLLLVEDAPVGGPAVRLLEMLATENVVPILGTVRERGTVHDEIEASGGEGIALGAARATSYPRALARTIRVTREREIDVIHAVEPIAGAIGCLAGLTARRPTVFDRQHSEVRWRQASLSRVACKAASMIRVPSETAKGYAIDQDRAHKSKLRVIPNAAFAPRPVDEAETARLKHDLGIPHGAPVVGTVARLRREKGIQIGIAALSERTLPNDVHYVIAGRGPYEEELRLAAAGHADRIHFVGHQSDIAPWFAIADVVWMPSSFDAAPIAAAEAMACARPLVASAVGGLREVVVDGVTGYLVPPNDPDALASATADLLAAPDRRDAFAAAARERYEARFAAESAVAALVACYRHLLTPG